MVEDISDVSDYVFREEIANRGYNVSLSDYSDSEIEDEYECRGLHNHTIEQYQEEALAIVYGLNDGKDMSKQIRDYFENVTGKLILMKVKNEK